VQLLARQQEDKTKVAFFNKDSKMSKEGALCKKLTW
jgi:hypothetical protein